MTEVPTGRLVVVGTGIRTVGQLTIEAIAWMKVADVVLHLVTDPVADELIRAWQPNTNRSLRVHYAAGRPRREAYESMAREIVGEVREGRVVCAALYGHPGVFARPTHLAIAAVRALGLRAEILPGISAEDCLFADLVIDPGDGCLSYEATNFVSFDHAADSSVHLVLWQIGVLGDWTHQLRRHSSPNIDVLVEKLRTWYPIDHPVTVYRASTVVNEPPAIQVVPLSELPRVELGTGHTLYVPPARPLRRDPTHSHRLQRTMSS